MTTKTTKMRASRNTQVGLTLIETTIALAIILIVAAGIMAATIVAIPATENEGHLSARATEYAQDKMEQLLELKFCDPTSDTTQLPVLGPAGYQFPSTGTGLTIGGSAAPAAPVAGYVDYLDADGNMLGGGATPPAGWYFMRQWQIASLPGALMTANCPSASPTTLLQITVSATVRTAAAPSSSQPLPTSTVVSIKSYPF